MSIDEVEKHICRAIDNLPERCREIFVMSKLKGMKYREIAESLGISQNTVEGQMAIALKKLRKNYAIVCLYCFYSESELPCFSLCRNDNSLLFDNCFSPIKIFLDFFFIFLWW